MTMPSIACQCQACRLERNEERLMSAQVRIPGYIMTGRDEEAVAAVAVAQPTFGVIR